MSRVRCAWANGDPLLAEYHDREWGVPSRDDRYLFEMINLEGAQAGLSWLTVLKKRDNYRSAFANFEPERLIKFTAARRARLITNAGLIRHPGKLAAVFDNARAVRALVKSGTQFSDFVWSFGDANALSRGLKAAGFRFVGPTICYAFMQAVGMVDDHAPECFRHARNL